MWVKDNPFPPQITLAAHIMSLEIRHRKPTDTTKELPDSPQFQQALESCQHYFKTGSCTHQFSPEFATNSDPPSPNYHSIVGSSIACLDWKLIAPNTKLHCHNCSTFGFESELSDEKTNLTQSRSLFPTWSGTGRPTPAILMNHKCERCDCKCKANDGRLLALLPAHIRNIHPVNPTHATGSFHFHLTSDSSDDLEENMLTHANSEVVGERLCKSMGKQCTKSVDTCLSQQPTKNHLSEKEFFKNMHPPSGQSLKQLCDLAATSSLTNYKCSKDERAVREMQSAQLTKADLAAVDWTWAPVNNHNVKGMMFAMNKGECFCCNAHCNNSTH